MNLFNTLTLLSTSPDSRDIQTKNYLRILLSRELDFFIKINALTLQIIYEKIRH